MRRELVSDCDLCGAQDRGSVERGTLYVCATCVQRLDARGEGYEQLVRLVVAIRDYCILEANWRADLQTNHYIRSLQELKPKMARIASVAGLLCDRDGDRYELFRELRALCSLRQRRTAGV